MQVRLAKDQKAQLLNGKDVYQIMQRVLLRQGKIRAKQEYLWMVGLQTDNTLEFIELLAIGSVNSVQIAPRELFRIAIIKNVYKVILVHNHPTGNVTPSRADKAITKHYSAAGDLLEIKIIDHLIISDKEYYSFSDHKLI